MWSLFSIEACGQTNKKPKKPKTKQRKKKQPSMEVIKAAAAATSHIPKHKGSGC